MHHGSLDGCGCCFLIHPLYLEAIYINPQEIILLINLNQLSYVLRVSNLY